ncbi:hypothetical protein ACFWN1_28480, partial [Streptomyces sp. NPDC058459]|uniref:hypothetical protein n=1 Tax=Streptomyces sp. NPDC058459 TaxID=3346508 RepID=UPI003653DDD8
RRIAGRGTAGLADSPAERVRARHGARPHALADRMPRAAAEDGVAGADFHHAEAAAGEADRRPVHPLGQAV